MELSGNSLDLPSRHSDISELDMDAIMMCEKSGAWYELIFSDDSELTVEHVIDVIRKIGSPLANHAEQYKAHFVIALHENRNTANTWTLMPAFENPRVAKQTKPLITRQIQDSWGHVIVSHSGDSYSDSEQIGVSDVAVPDGSYAFDVSKEHGIHVDLCTKLRNIAQFNEAAWVGFDGGFYDSEPADNMSSHMVVIGQIAIPTHDRQ